MGPSRNPGDGGGPSRCPGGARGAVELDLDLFDVKVRVGGLLDVQAERKEV